MTRAECRAFADDIVDALYDDEDDGRAAAFHTHADECTACLTRLATFRQTRARVTEALAEDAEAPAPDFTDRILAAAYTAHALATVPEATLETTGVRIAVRLNLPPHTSVELVTSPAPTESVPTDRAPTDNVSSDRASTNVVRARWFTRLLRRPEFAAAAVVGFLALGAAAKMSRFSPHASGASPAAVQKESAPGAHATATESGAVASAAPLVAPAVYADGPPAPSPALAIAASAPAMASQAAAPRPAAPMHANAKPIVAGAANGAAAKAPAPADLAERQALAEKPRIRNLAGPKKAIVAVNDQEAKSEADDHPTKGTKNTARIDAQTNAPKNDAPQNSVPQLASKNRRAALAPIDADADKSGFAGGSHVAPAPSPNDTTMR